MFRTLAIATGVALTLLTPACADVRNQQGAIMQTVPGDPAGSASIGTGSVTTNSMIAPEAWSAGIGLGP